MTARRTVPAAVVVMVAVLALLGLATGQPASAGQRVGARSSVGGLDDSIHLNQIQVVGSHNSYHVEGSQAEKDLRRSFIGDGENLLEYGHVPLGQQFAEQKVRQVELDVYRDDAGGKYANPLIRQVTGGGPYDPEMNQPGTKVLHVQDVDYRSSCLKFTDCLAAVKTWSDANPSHVPIAILIELEDQPVPFTAAGITFVVPDPWTAPGALDGLDNEIRSVFSPSDLITPDQIRGTHATLEEAVLQDGWPTLGASRGKVMFLMDNGGGYRNAYLTGHPNLNGRILFTNSSPGQPDAAFVEVNDSRNNVAYIQSLVQKGYVVRSRADSDTVEARNNDITARDAAFQSGAQWVSTDYPTPSYARDKFSNDYLVRLPGNIVARCNPVNAPPGCVDTAVETGFDETAVPEPPPPPPSPTPPPPAPTPLPGAVISPLPAPAVNPLPTYVAPAAPTYSSEPATAVYSAPTYTG